MKQLIFSMLIMLAVSHVHAETKTAIFAGGCFWCMEPPYDKLEGVFSTVSGYTGGHTDNPTYKKTSTGTTGHYEALAVEYDPQIVSYEKLLDVFWKNIDPFDARGQFCDKGPQYRAAIFYMNDEEKQLAEKSLQQLQERVGNGNRVVTEILPAKKFFDAEDYHQDYYKKNPIRYKYYRYGCGRDKRLKEVNQLLGTK